MTSANWMTRYERLWLGVCVTVCAIGIWIACAVVPGACLGLVGVAAVMGAFVTFVVLEDAESGPTHTHRGQAMATNAAVAGASVGAFVGFVVVLEGAAFVLALVLAASSPAALRGGWSLCRGAISSPNFRWASLVTGMAYAGADYAAAVVPRLDELTDEQLCEAWRQTCDALAAAPSAPATSRIVRERADYVEELTRRSPMGVTAWLVAGPVAVRDPLRFITQSYETNNSIDWNLLIPGQDH